MLELIAALLGAAQPALDAGAAPGAQTEWIFATVGHSEWCPAGHVTLDLRTGRYSLTPRASRRLCGKSDLERPVIKGRLTPNRLDALRSAYEEVLAEGLESRACREHLPNRRIVISNGGTPILVVATGAATGSAPGDLSCWSDSANALHEALEDMFEPYHDR